MGLNSSIEWTDHTVNLWWGCTKVHTGCKNCYAETFSNRFNNNLWGPQTGRKWIASSIETLNKINSNAKAKKRIEKVFVGSMMDIFEEKKMLVDKQGNILDVYYSPYETTEQCRDSLFNLISTGVFDNILFLFLTKRPENVINMVPAQWIDAPPANVVIGSSASNQETFDNSMRWLIKWPGKRFVSLEPQVDSISLGIHRPDWVIQGGESGPKKTKV